MKYFLLFNFLLFITVKFRINWFSNNCLLSKNIDHTRSDIHSCCISSNFQRGYFFLNKINIGIFIMNSWCIENPYKQMDMWATPFLKFNTYGILFVFPKRPSSTISSTLSWKYLATSTRLLFNRLFLTDNTVLDNLIFLVLHH